MPFWSDSHEQDALEEALGTDEVSGYHVEIYYPTHPFWDEMRRGDGTRFPCIDGENRYQGCLGAECDAQRCWAGRLVPSAQHFQAARVPLPNIERKGAKCHQCVSAVDSEGGKVICAHGHFDQAITPAGLIRRRIPESAPIPCPDYERRQELRSDVAAYRKRRRAKAAEALEPIQDERQAG